MRFIVGIFTLMVVSLSFANKYPEFDGVNPISLEVSEGFSELYSSKTGSSDVLIQFWASWCHSCSGFMYDLDDFASSNHVSDSYFAISVDHDIAIAREYVSKTSFFHLNKSRFWFDSNGNAKSFYEVDSIPTVILVNQDGIVVWRKSGHLNSGDFLEMANLLGNGNSNFNKE